MDYINYEVVMNTLSLCFIDRMEYHQIHHMCMLFMCNVYDYSRNFRKRHNNKDVLIDQYTHKYNGNIAFVIIWFQ